ncbi:MAG TPA: hypothetical protein PLQ12_12470, partial [Candidatus Defluviicoccus seviourii]|nr:hypothetical protein [Candidatus Defluviicoccus seviourii]
MLQQSVPGESGGGEAPLKLFYSYAHEDENLRQQLVVHLSVLRRSGFIEEWSDRKIAAGVE